MYGPARQAYRRNVEWDKWGRDRRSGMKTAEEKLMPYSLPMQHLEAIRLGGASSVRYLRFQSHEFQASHSVSPNP